VHFKHFAPKGLDYAVNRYLYEARRHFGILDAQLNGRRFLLGETYTIADMAAWGWTRVVPFVLGDDAWNALPNLKRWFDLVSARPAAIRANALKDKHSFKAELDDEARRHLFRHIAPA
jgi:GST-like protein